MAHNLKYSPWHLALTKWTKWFRESRSIVYLFTILSEITFLKFIERHANFVTYNLLHTRAALNRIFRCLRMKQDAASRENDVMKSLWNSELWPLLIPTSQFSVK
jgi:hypothetical protein